MKSISRAISFSSIVVVEDLPTPVAVIGGCVTGSKRIALVRPDATLPQLLALDGAA